MIEISPLRLVFCICFFVENKNIPKQCFIIASGRYITVIPPEFTHCASQVPYNGGKAPQINADSEVVNIAKQRDITSSQDNISL